MKAFYELPGHGSSFWERSQEKKFWDQCLHDTLWSPEFVEDFLNSDLTLHCSSEYLAVAEQYKKYFDQQKRPITFKSHIIECNINDGIYFLELPAVKLDEKVDVTPYINMISGVIKIKESTGIDLGVNTAITRSIMYAVRLGLNLAPIYRVAMKYGIKLAGIDRITARCEKVFKKVQTIDIWLVEWLQTAARSCNSINQLMILKQIYIQAAKFNTKQPRICKSTISNRLNIDRKIIRRLFDRLIQRGLISESPETYQYDFINRKPISDARIINLNYGNEPDRWISYKAQLILRRASRSDKVCSSTCTATKLHVDRRCRSSKMMKNKEPLRH